MYRFLLFALVIWTGQQIAQAYFHEPSGTYDDDTPWYETLPASDAVLMGDIEIGQDRNAINSAARLWTNGVIPYVLHSNFPANVQNRILASMREIEHNVNTPGRAYCIHFIPRTNHQHYIYVLPRQGCSSPVGWQHTGPQEVSIGRGCEHKGIIMHELMHAIGFWHEQSRPDRDSYVNINLRNVQAGQTHNFDRFPHALTLGYGYDYSSLMHYSAYEFAASPRVPVMTPKYQTSKWLKMGQRMMMSLMDTLKIQKLYSCNVDSSHVTSRIENGAHNCNFLDDFCSFNQNTYHDFEWQRTTYGTATGPGAGDSNGLDPYAIAQAGGHYGKYARLRSVTLTFQHICIEWWFWNHGGQGSINLIMVDHRGNSQTVKTYGPQSQGKWMHVFNSFTINGYAYGYTFIFEAHVANADIGLDDIHFYEGACV